MDDSTRAVLAHVDPRELVELAGELIRIPSFKTEETPSPCSSSFRGRGYEVDLQEIEPGRFQSIATLRGTGGGASLMLNGHTDINALTRRWKRDPWTPSLEGDRLYGHGVQNMKGGLASIIMTAEAVRRSGIRLPGDLVVACVAGETQGGRHALPDASGPRTDARGGRRTVRRRQPRHRALGHRAHGDSRVRVTGHRAARGHRERSAEMTAPSERSSASSSATRPAPTCVSPAQRRGILGSRGQDYVLVEPPYVPICARSGRRSLRAGQTVDGIVADIHRALDPSPRDSKSPHESRSARRLRGPPPSRDGPVDMPTDAPIVQAVAKPMHRDRRGAEAIGTVLPHRTAPTTCHLWKAGIPCLLYGPATIRGNADEDDACVLVSEMEKVTRVLAATAVDVCRRKPAELAVSPRRG
jgi:acetylornithine deacetylase